MIDGWYGRIPRIRIVGEPYARGQQYGRAAGTLISRAIEIYQDWFGSFAGVPWDQALSGASRIGAHIARHCPELAAELKGIADGSGLPEHAIVAINARTEIAYGLGLATQLVSAEREGCTSWAILPEHTNGAGPLCGQNWDWLAACMEVRVALHVQLPSGSELLTLCEAGQVGKMGFNSAGLVACLNLLSTVADSDAGLPVHILCRLVLEQEQLSGAARVISSYPRAASSNMLVARGLPDGNGEAMDIEYSPLTWAAIGPDDGVLVHANHFLTDPGAVDQTLIREGTKSTYLRHIRGTRRVREAIRTAAAKGAGVTVEDLWPIHADHFDHPYGICAHVSGNPGEESQTNLAFLASPSGGEFWLSDGPPCGQGHTEQAYQRYRMPWAGDGSQG